jgi:hypothetical protein
VTLRLVGVPIENELVHELASRLRDIGDTRELNAAEKLEYGLSRDLRLVALTIADREAVLSVLDDPRDGLEELRSVLLADHQRRRNHGLNPMDYDDV